MAVPYVNGFEPYSLEDRRLAIGEFPDDRAEESRLAHLPPPPSAGGWSRPSLASGGEAAEAAEAVGQCNDPRWFREPSSSGAAGKGKGKRQRKNGPPLLWPELNPPRDENDWLAQVNEAGQDFGDYTDFVTMRSGRFKPSHFGGATGGAATTARNCIGLVPIVAGPPSGSGSGSGSGSASSSSVAGGAWPDHGPSFEALVRLTEIYFDREVRVLDSATLTLAQLSKSKPGGFTSAAKWEHRQSGGSAIIKQCRVAHVPEKGAGDFDDEFAGSGGARVQVHVDPLLAELGKIRERGGVAVDDCFAIMGVTMIDLYSGSTDLFVAGMAAGASNVAVFSFHRYHPCIKMDPGQWYDYAYVTRSSDYSYYEDGKKRPATKPTPPTTDAIQSKMLFRAGKLLVHEMMHIFGIDHCVMYECIMKGTGHLVEDFSAPIHLCPVDLRKMQWRLGVSIPGRYRTLSAFYKEQGWRSEKAWVDNALRMLSGDGSGGNGKDGQACTIDLSGDTPSSAPASALVSSSSFAGPASVSGPSPGSNPEVVELLDSDSGDSDYIDITGEKGKAEGKAEGTAEDEDEDEDEDALATLNDEAGGDEDEDEDEDEDGEGLRGGDGGGAAAEDDGREGPGPNFLMAASAKSMGVPVDVFESSFGECPRSADQARTMRNAHIIYQTKSRQFLTALAMSPWSRGCFRQLHVPLNTGPLHGTTPATVNCGSYVGNVYGDGTKNSCNGSLDLVQKIIEAAEDLYDCLIRSGKKPGDDIEGLTLVLRFKTAQDESHVVGDDFLGESRLSTMCMLAAMRMMGGAAVSRFQFYPANSGRMHFHEDMITLGDLNRYVVTVHGGGE